MEVITMKEMLEAMETGYPFSISFVSCDLQRKAGGQIKKYKEVVLNAPTEKQKESRKETKGKTPPATKKRVRGRRNPHHYEHSTRSFRVCVNGCKTKAVKKFHLFLVLTFNDKKLML